MTMSPLPHPPHTHTHMQRGSDVGSRTQRCSEQLVLYAKAVSMLESALLVYELNMASASKEPSDKHRKGMLLHIYAKYSSVYTG